jgi:hypothetical protein
MIRSNVSSEVSPTGEHHVELAETVHRHGNGPFDCRNVGDVRPQRERVRPQS